MSWADVKNWFIKEGKTILYVHVGCVMFALSVTLFIAPLKMPNSGITGLSLFLYYLWNVPLGVSTVVLNGLLFVYGYKVLNRRFFWWSVYSTVLLSLLFPLTEGLTPPNIGDPLVVALVAGVLQGLALAMIFSVGTSSGGTDILVMAIKRKKGYEVGTLSMWLNFAVIALFIPITNINMLCYALINTYVKGVVMNNDIRAFATVKEALIIPREPAKVKDFILHDLQKGVTIFTAHGGFDGKPHQVFITLLRPRQAMRLKFFLKEQDPQAFLRLGEVNEVLGKGFGSLHHDV